MVKLKRLLQEASHAPPRKLRMEALEERQMLDAAPWLEVPCEPPNLEAYLSPQASQTSEIAETSCERDVVTIPNTILFQAS